MDKQLSKDLREAEATVSYEEKKLLVCKDIPLWEVSFADCVFSPSHESSCLGGEVAYRGFAARHCHLFPCSQVEHCVHCQECPREHLLS